VTGIKYEPKLRSRERQLIFGPAGAGKSEACYSVAKMVNGSVYVLDNDYSWERMIETDKSGFDAKNFEVTELYHDDWKGLMKGLDDAVDNGDRDDLLVIDSMTPTWQAVQESFTEEIFGTDIDAYFLQVRKEQSSGKNLEAFDGWKDWQVINKMYSRLYRGIARFPGHVMLTAEADGVSGGEEDDIKGLFGPYRAKPRGQKRLAHTVNTVTLVSKSRAQEFTMTVCKDRGRERDEKIEKEEFDDYGVDFMIGVAGWTPVKEDG
jgi:hypothetical protein